MQTHLLLTVLTCKAIYGAELQGLSMQALHVLLSLHQHSLWHEHVQNQQAELWLQAMMHLCSHLLLTGRSCSEHEALYIQHAPNRFFNSSAERAGLM